MGNGCGKTTVEYMCPRIAGFHPFESSERQRSRMIDSEIKCNHERTSKVIKVLLLGPGESGKSTIIKQIKHIHCKGKKLICKIYSITRVYFSISVFHCLINYLLFCLKGIHWMNLFCTVQLFLVTQYKV